MTMTMTMNIHLFSQREQLFYYIISKDKTQKSMKEGGRKGERGREKERERSG